MFKKNNRYVTRGINEEVDIRLQLIMWSMIDKLKDEGKVELDYLQVFKLRKEGNKIVVRQNWSEKRRRNINANPIITDGINK